LTFLGKLYVVGGNDGQSCLSTVEIFDPATYQWSFGPTINMPRANVGVSVIQDRLFAVGGFSGKLFLNNIEYLSADCKQWCMYVPQENKMLAAASSMQSLNGELDDDQNKQKLDDHQNSPCKITEMNSFMLE
jgi:influenza virus NS1A-binding protein